MRIKLNNMKKIIILLISQFIVLFTVNAQKGIDFNSFYAAGGRLLMNLDSSANNVFYSNIFPNQPNTFFNYLPEVNNISLQINFRDKDNAENYRYTILLDDKPVVLNKSIDTSKLILTNAGGDEEIFRYTTIGVYPIKGKTITTLIYSIERPLDIEKSVFYGKPIPKSKITVFAKRFKTEKGVDYNYITEPKESIDFTFTEKDDELTIVKERTDVDYLYYTTIKDKKTDKLIFESTSWLYGGYLNEADKLSPYIKIDKSVFKKSGDYEITIQPLIKWDNCNTSPAEIEKSTARYTLAITLDEENYSKKELLTYASIVALSIGLIALIFFYIIKKRNKKKLAENEQQKNSTKLQLNSIRSQLNPHFMFNALSGIQNLMNKNELNNANKYLSKFARLTRNVLDDKESISLAQERTLLEDYLQMEQLRFGFEYEIIPSENLDVENIEIPSMLLQPFVENAVKHGISQKATIGKIIIEFIKKANDLMLTITDNGNGFDTENKNSGLGLQLSESRIALLNSIYKENHFNLAIQSTSNGTKINLILTDWV